VGTNEQGTALEVHRAQSTEHRAQNTEHRAQSTEHRAQNTRQRQRPSASASPIGWPDRLCVRFVVGWGGVRTRPCSLVVFVVLRLDLFFSRVQSHLWVGGWGAMVVGGRSV
jgi:hypothetical protein